MASTPDDVWVDLGAFIREQRQATRISMRKLAELSEVSNPYLSQIERGLRKPSADILQQIARALQISAETLYVRAGILDEDFGSPDLIAQIHTDPDLTKQQRAALIAQYEQFRAETRSARLPQRESAENEKR